MPTSCSHPPPTFEFDLMLIDTTLSKFGHLLHDPPGGDDEAAMLKICMLENPTIVMVRRISALQVEQLFFRPI